MDLEVEIKKQQEFEPCTRIGMLVAAAMDISKLHFFVTIQMSNSVAQWQIEIMRSEIDIICFIVTTFSILYIKRRKGRSDYL